MLSDTEVESIKLHLDSIEESFYDVDMKAALRGCVNVLRCVEPYSEHKREHEPASVQGVRACVRLLMCALLEWDGDRSKRHKVRKHMAGLKTKCDRLVEDTEDYRA